MSTKHQLEQMKLGWEMHGLSQQFPTVHHFSSAKFKTKPPGLKGFYNWCKERGIQDENYQTLQRANRVIALIEDGNDTHVAITQAWREFPICKR